MKIRFLTFAQQEIDEAYLWFEERSAGKGVEFLDELDRAVRLVRAYPLASPEIEPGVRRCLFVTGLIETELGERPIFPSQTAVRGVSILKAKSLLGGRKWRKP